MFHRGFFLSFFVNVSTDFMEAPSIMKVRVCGGGRRLGRFPLFCLGMHIRLERRKPARIRGLGSVRNLTYPSAELIQYVTYITH
ncbi:hypothetical protein ABH19_01565 [Leptospirillum sp. Group II 'CF-1']|jgi:hypothetical protein|nr:hypothetical protein ABH19_01565 [Leptospirillum sp. Group II 'CF-1']